MKLNVCLNRVCVCYSDWTLSVRYRGLVMMVECRSLSAVFHWWRKDEKGKLPVTDPKRVKHWRFINNSSNSDLCCTPQSVEVCWRFCSFVRIFNFAYNPIYSVHVEVTTYCGYGLPAVSAAMKDCYAMALEILIIKLIQHICRILNIF